MVHSFSFRWFERLLILFGARCYFVTESDRVRCAAIALKPPLWVGETVTSTRLPDDPPAALKGL